jgi:Fe/S biogenesis protein NfuA
VVTTTPRLRATDVALTRIDQVRANRGQPQAGVRIDITGRRDGAFVYDMQLVAPGEQRDGDVVVQGPNGVQFHVPAAAAAYLDNATVDADAPSGALRIDNPNPLWFDPVAQGIQEFIDDEVNPMVASHGGVIGLLDVAGGVAYIEMGGGCQGCGMADVTLKQGVRQAIIERFPEITDVRDSTDHALGTDPYYQAEQSATH